MRDPKRIYEICMMLAQAWSYYPDLRLMQIVDLLKTNLKFAMHSDTDPFYVEDDVWLQVLKWMAGDTIESNNNMRKESDNNGNT